MLTLGIETSCDETAAAVVENADKICSNIVSSSLHLHREYGGVVPEIACRAHVECINQVVKEALSQANCVLTDIDIISVTKQPGLIGALLVGMSMAKALALSLNIPLVEVDHLHAHVIGSIMQKNGWSFPLTGLVVSGGHTTVFLVRDFDKFRLLGQTIDDAAGEAFDKAAKILGLGYPGGPQIEERAKKGNPKKINFPRSLLKEGSLDFSFSGLKTSVLYYVKKAGEMSEGQVNDICASFQEAVVDVLTEKAMAACRKNKVKALAVGGGVSVNARFREKLKTAASANDVDVYLPDKPLCLDNAAMVAGLGYQLYKKTESRKEAQYAL